MTGLDGQARLPAPSAGYILSVSVACVGIACLDISIGGALIARQGGNAADTLDVDGW